MKMRSLITLQVFTVLSLASLPVCAKAVFVPQCPQRLPIQQIIQTNVGDNWKIINSAYTHHLQYISTSSYLDEYSPEQGGVMIPTSEKYPKYTIAHYDTRPDTSGKHDMWVVCEYMDSAAVLVQKLPENVMRCEVKYFNDVTVPNRVTIRCFDTPRDRVQNSVHSPMA